MSKVSVLSIDLGAGSGRGIVVQNDGNSFKLKEVNRFSNDVIIEKDNNRLSWDIDKILKNIKECIKKAYEFDNSLKSVGIDTWGVDYGWIDKNGSLLKKPRSYREEIDKSVIDKVHSIIPLEELYQINGNAYFNFNTIYQIYKDIHIDKILEKGADKFLFMPNLLYYLLTGQYAWEYTISSTSGLMDVRKRDWSNYILEKLSIPKNIKGNISMPGSQKANIKKEILKELGIDSDIVVSLSAGHDTASAVIGLQVKNKEAYFITGTWCLFGLELSEPVTDEHGIKKGLVNEGSFNGRIRYLKMFLGTWLIRAIKEEFSTLGFSYSYDDLCNIARSSNEKGFLEIDDSFILPKSMISLFKDRYQKKYSKTIEKNEDIVRLAYNTLVSTSKAALEELQSTSNSSIDSIVMAGGGTKDSLLIELIEKEINKTVSLGFAEASSLGNAIVQLFALGVIKSIDKTTHLYDKNKIEVL